MSAPNHNEPVYVPGNLKFEHLPVYAEFLLGKKLNEYVDVQLKLAFEMNAPFLKHLSQFSREDLHALSVTSNKEFLEAVQQNTLTEYTNESLSKWLKNELVVINNDQLVAEDISLTTYLRKKGFYAFLSEYTSDLTLMMKLIEEIEEYSHYFNSKGHATYFSMYESRMNEINKTIRKNKQKLLEAQAIAKIGSFEWDMSANGKSEYTPQVYQIFEMEKFTTLGDFYDYVHVEDKNKLRDAISKAVNGETDYFECEYRYAINGHEKVIWSRGIVEKTDGKPAFLRGTIMDVTERSKILNDLNRLNTILDQKNKELKRSNEELTSFSYAASHDLQEPLRKIKTFSNILIEKETSRLSEDGKLYLGKIDNAAMRMQRLIHDLLAFSRTQTNRDARKKVSLGLVIDQIKNTYEDLISDQKLEIVSADLPDLEAVPFQLQQLFENIIGNSVKYKKADEAARIEISSVFLPKPDIEEGDPEKRYYKISITDNGIGFEDQYSEKIFEIFHRLHGKAEYSGTGIGLAICKKIVENHDGFIKAKGRPGEGATFTIYFPVM